jgi:uncharacterized protein YxeA
MLNKKVLVGLLAVTAVVFSGGYVFGQQKTELKIDDALGVAQTTLRNGDKGDAVGDFVGIYNRAARSRGATDAVVVDAMISYFYNYRSTKSADNGDEALVKLAALQVIQNQRIIELLERQAAVKK